MASRSETFRGRPSSSLFPPALKVIGLAGFAREARPFLGVTRDLYGDAELLRAVADAPGPTGRTMLMHAAAIGDLPRLTALIAAGAALELESEEDYFELCGPVTALMHASRNGQAPCCDALLDAGAHFHMDAYCYTSIVALSGMRALQRRGDVARILSRMFLEHSRFHNPVGALDAGMPAALIAFLSLPIAQTADGGDVADTLLAALRHLADMVHKKARGAQALADAGAPRALMRQAQLTIDSGGADNASNRRRIDQLAITVCRVAVCGAAAADALVAAGAVKALAALSVLPCARGSETALALIADTYAVLAQAEGGRAALLTARAPAVLAGMPGADSSWEIGVARARAWAALAEDDAGRAACVDAGALRALAELARGDHDWSNSDVEDVARAFTKLAGGAAGAAACVGAGALEAFVALTRCDWAGRNADVARAVAEALAAVGRGSGGAARGRAAGAGAALEALGQKAAVKGSRGPARALAAAAAVFGGDGRKSHGK